MLIIPFTLTSWIVFKILTPTESSPCTFIVPVFEMALLLAASDLLASNPPLGIIIFKSVLSVPAFLGFFTIVIPTLFLPFTVISALFSANCIFNPPWYLLFAWLISGRSIIPALFGVFNSIVPFLVTPFITSLSFIRLTLVESSDESKLLKAKPACSSTPVAPTPIIVPKFLTTIG